MMFRFRGLDMRGTLTKIIEAHQASIPDEGRGYIGASNIGSDCLRQIWYEYKATMGQPPLPKYRRARDIGKYLEELVLDWLEDSGIDTITGISRDQKYRDLKSKNIDSFRGHVDALMSKNGEIVAIIEIKTAKDSSFKSFLKNGVKSWNPQYYAQSQAYMGMSGIHKTYFVVLNKDSSEIMDERVSFDEDFYRKLEEKAMLISQTQTEPPRISGSPIWFQCKLCKYNKICHS